MGESASCKKMKEGRKRGSMSGVGRGRGRRGRWTNRENLPPSSSEPGNVPVRITWYLKLSEKLHYFMQEFQILT
jgi:hypothetical protein